MSCCLVLVAFCSRQWREPRLDEFFMQGVPGRSLRCTITFSSRFCVILSLLSPFRLFPIYFPRRGAVSMACSQHGMQQLAGFEATQQRLLALPAYMRSRVYASVVRPSVCPFHNGPRQRSLLLWPGRQETSIDCRTAQSSASCGERMRAVPRRQRT